MSDKVETPVKAEPQLPKRVDGKEDESSKERVYKLEYRNTNFQGNSRGGVRNFMFNFRGNLENARYRIRQHCDMMGFIFIHCEVAIVDLDAREARLVRESTEEILTNE